MHLIWPLVFVVVFYSEGPFRALPTAMGQGRGATLTVIDNHPWLRNFDPHRPLDFRPLARALYLRQNIHRYPNWEESRLLKEFQITHGQLRLLRPLFGPKTTDGVLWTKGEMTQLVHELGLTHEDLRSLQQQEIYYFNIGTFYEVAKSQMSVEQWALIGKSLREQLMFGPRIWDGWSFDDTRVSRHTLVTSSLLKLPLSTAERQSLEMGLFNLLTDKFNKIDFNRPGVDHTAVIEKWVLEHKVLFQDEFQYSVSKYLRQAVEREIRNRFESGDYGRSRQTLLEGLAEGWAQKIKANPQLWEEFWKAYNSTPYGKRAFFVFVTKFRESGFSQIPELVEKFELFAKSFYVEYWQSLQVADLAGFMDSHLAEAILSEEMKTLNDKEQFVRLTDILGGYLVESKNHRYPKYKDIEEILWKRLQPIATNHPGEYKQWIRGLFEKLNRKDLYGNQVRLLRKLAIFQDPIAAELKADLTRFFIQQTKTIVESKALTRYQTALEAIDGMEELLDPGSYAVSMAGLRQFMDHLLAQGYDQEVMRQMRIYSRVRTYVINCDSLLNR